MTKKCNFCNSVDSKRNRVISAENSNICESCAEVALNIIKTMGDEESEDMQDINLIEDKTPKDYKNILDEFVIGQDNAKKVLSVAIFNHIKRISNPSKNISKSNVLFIGPTGSGKTFLAETISKHLDIPLAIVNTTSLTAAGYIGEDVSSVLERLWKDAGEDVSRAENGIIFLD